MSGVERLYQIERAPAQLVPTPAAPEQAATEDDAELFAYLEAQLMGEEPPGLSIITYGLEIQGSCNFGCDNCYMYQGENAPNRKKYHPMPIPVVEATALRAAESALANKDQDIYFVLHGGEPFMNHGRHLFKVAETIRQILEEKAPDVRVHLRAQTNAVFLNEKILDRCRELGIRIGVSIDGLPDAHNQSRPLDSGKPSWELVEKKVKLLRDKYPDLFLKIICTLGEHNLGDDPVATHNWLDALRPEPVIDDKGVIKHQVDINYVLPHATWDSPPPLWDSTGKDTPYATWLCTLFDYLFDSFDSRLTSIPLFRSIYQGFEFRAGRRTAPPNGEIVGLQPGRVAFVEGDDGSIRGPDSLKSGGTTADQTNLTVFTPHILKEVVRHPLIALTQLGEKALSQTCLNCPLLQVCGGGQFAHRRRGNNFRNPSVYCDDLKTMMSHMEERYAPLMQF